MLRTHRASLSSVLLWLFIGGAACRGDSDNSSVGTSGLTAGSGDACDKTAIDNFGTLPACAAGRATRTRPGTPDDHTGPVKASLLLNASERAAKAIADEIGALRFPPGVDPVELGYPPIPAAARVNPKGGAQ